MSVAESIVIFRPIDQVGWLSASAGVMLAKLSRGRDAERAARGGEHEPPHLLRPAAVEALVERAVLAVDGQQARAGFARPRDHQLARHHQCFLVREGHVLARLERAVGRYEAHRADRRRHDDAGLGMRRDLYHPVGADAHPDAGEIHEAREGLAGWRRRHRDQLRPIARDLLRQPLDVRAGREADDAEASAKGIHDAQDVGAHRAGGAEDGEAFHSPKPKRPRNSGPTRLGYRTGGRGKGQPGTRPG